MKQKGRGGDDNGENEHRVRWRSRPPSEIKADMRALDTEIQGLVNALTRLQVMRRPGRKLARTGSGELGEAGLLA